MIFFTLFVLILDIVMTNDRKILAYDKIKTIFLVESFYKLK